MFVTHESTQKAYNAVMPILKTMKRGDTLTYQLITALTGISRDNKAEWKALVSAIRGKSRGMMSPDNGGIWLKAVDNVGFLLCDANEQLNQYTYHAKKAGRQWNRAKSKVDAIPDVILSELKRTLKHAMSDSARTSKNHSHRMKRFFARKNSN